MKKAKIFFVSSFVLLGGCAGIALEPAGSDGDLERHAASAPVCTDDQDCQVKWRRAEQWVKAHSYWPVQTVTEQTIATESPRYRYLPQAQYRVTRQKTADGRTAIGMQVFCTGSVHCEPDPTLAQADFNYFVKHGRHTGWAD